MKLFLRSFRYLVEFYTVRWLMSSKQSCPLPTESDRLIWTVFRTCDFTLKTFYPPKCTNFGVVEIFVFADHSIELKPKYGSEFEAGVEIPALKTMVSDSAVGNNGAT